MRVVCLRVGESHAVFILRTTTLIGFAGDDAFLGSWWPYKPRSVGVLGKCSYVKSGDSMRSLDCFVVLRAFAPRRVRPANELMTLRGVVNIIEGAYRLERSVAPISM